MSRRVALCLVAATLGVSAATAAQAHLSINKLWVDFTEGKDDRSDVVIRNDSTDRYYITVAVAEIVNPGTPDEKRVEESDPEAAGLLVTPNRIVMEPGALRSIRLVSLNHDLAKDRVYRVLISPQIGSIQAAPPPGEQRELAIKMLAAYDVLVVVRPNGSSAKLEADRQPTSVVLRNDGNTNVLVADGMTCPSSTGANPSPDACDKLETQRLYAGNSMTVPIKTPSDQLIVRTRDSATSEFLTRKF